MFNLYTMCFKIASRHQFTGRVSPCGIYADTIAVDVQYSFSSLMLHRLLQKSQEWQGKNVKGCVVQPRQVV